MALTDFQRTVCRLLAGQRLASGESYVAGATALNELIGAARISRDIDVFHDTDEALLASWDADRHVLHEHGFDVRIVRERPAFVEADVSRAGETVRMEWARDSAFRFFPLVEHPDLGLTLHPFDLATNKVLALVGRLEARDWVDVIHASERLQPLGYLAWAACAKDPAFGPASILEHAARSTHYSAAEIRALSFAGEPPDPAALARRWHSLLSAAREVVALLPPTEVGSCVLTVDGTLFTGDAAALRLAWAEGSLVFHSGRIRGALPRPKPTG
ncbi:MAG TPA: nucleotidyl transferase AbiEii/AbiGii toxin family protein [Candidatus Tectomicrobia bacterium]|nr:nucleotidyl transferase AbiEii/AbiGii toxin family protein [Candidatus Tectomicrobia bacterium]